MSSKRKSWGSWSGKSGKSSYDYDYDYDWDWDDDDSWGGGSWGSGKPKKSGGDDGGGDSDTLEEMPFTRLNYDSFNLSQLADRVLRKDLDMSGKLDRFARKAWQSTLKTSNNTGGLMTKRVEGFVHDWIQDTLGRCWQSILSSYEEPSKLTGVMSAEVFSLMSKRLGLIGTDKPWQISPTSRVIERTVRQTWPQYFPKVPCNIDEWRPGGEKAAQKGSDRNDRGSASGKQRRPDKDAHAEDSWEGGARDGASRRDKRGPLENPNTIALRTKDRSRSPRSKGGGAREKQQPQRSARSPSADRRSSAPKGGLRLSPRRGQAAASARGDRSRSRSKSSVKGSIKLTENQNRAAPQREARSGDERASASSKRGAAEGPLQLKSASQRTSAKQELEDHEPEKSSKWADNVAEQTPEQDAGEAETAQAAEEPVATEEGAVYEYDEDDDEEEHDDDALGAMMAQAMEAAAAAGPPSPENYDTAATNAEEEAPEDSNAPQAEDEAPTTGPNGDAESSKSKPGEAAEEEAPVKFDTIEQALKSLLTTVPMRIVSGCGSAEACPGCSSDVLHRFEGFEEYPYCASCCKMLRNEYPALQTAQLIRQQ